jgi:hypothetical protein
MVATSVLVVLHKATMMMVDCGKGTGDRAMQQPTNFLCCIAREQAMIAKTQSASNEMHCNEDIADVQ